MTDTIIFDVGNVLLRVENDSIRTDISKTLRVDPETVHSAWEKLVVDLLAKGKISEKEFWKRFIKTTGSQIKKVPKDLLYRQLEKRFTPYIEVLRIVDTLKANGYKLGIISDTIESHAAVARKHGIFKPFDVVILSHEAGIRKPDPKIFKLALKKLKSVPENSVFIDDIFEYVDAAKNLGFKGIVFKNPVQFQNELLKLGINTAFLPDKEETNIGCHALLITPENEIILQKRWEKITSVNPGKISMFGGTLEKNESIKEGLRRELSEEIEIDIKKYRMKKLGIYKKTKELDGADFTIHIYMVFNVDLKNLTLNEGEGFAVGPVNVLLKNQKITRITRLALMDYSKI